MQLVLALLIVMSTLSFAHSAKPVADALRFDPRQMRSDLIKFNVAYARSEGDGNPRRERNLARLSAKWVPVLQRAETEGGAIATVLLRYCDSAPELLRTDIDSTCSQDVSAVARAYERLRAVGLGSLPDQPARFEVIGDTLRDNVRSKCTDARREACTVELAIELIDARIRAIERDAVLPPIPGLQRFVCNDARKDA